MDAEMKNRIELKGYAFAYATAVLYGGCTTVASLVMRGPVNNTTFLFLRAAICALTLAAVNLIVKRKDQRPWKSYLRMMLLGALVYATQSAIYFTAVRNNPASLTTVIYSLYPIFVPFLVGAADRKRPELKALPPMCLAILGLALVLDMKMEGFSVYGTVCGILATFGFAVYVVIGSRLEKEGERLDAMDKTMCVMAGSGTSFLIFGLLTGSLKLAEAAPSMAGVVLIALVFTLLPMCFFWSAVRLIGPEKASIPSIFEPVSGIILAMILIGERLTALQFLGIAIVLAALFFAQKKS